MKGKHKGVAWEVRPRTSHMGGFTAHAEFNGVMERFGWSPSKSGAVRMAKERAKHYAERMNGQ